MKGWKNLLPSLHDAENYSYKHGDTVTHLYIIVVFIKHVCIDDRSVYVYSNYIMKKIIQSGQCGVWNVDYV